MRDWMARWAVNLGTTSWPIRTKNIFEWNFTRRSNSSTALAHAKKAGLSLIHVVSSERTRGVRRGSRAVVAVLVLLTSNVLAST